MSVIRNRLLFTTCLSILTGTVSLSAPVMAGFEWMPPEKNVVETAPPVVPEVIEDADIMAPVSVVDEVVVEAEEEIIPQKEEFVPEVDVITEMPEQEDDVAPEQIIVKEIKDTQKPVMHSDRTDEDVFELEPVAAPEDKKVESTDGQITLNPYPVKSDATPSTDVVILSDDENDEIEENAAPPEMPLEYSNDDILHYDVIEGFGSEMPLALALSQVVPPQYAYSFAQGVNPGVVVSWDGGAPWNDVLNTALKPVGYVAYIQDKMVLIKNHSASMPEKHGAVQPPADLSVTPAETAMTEKKTIDSGGVGYFSENAPISEPAEQVQENNEFHHAQEGAVYEPPEEVILQNGETKTSNIEEPAVEVIDAADISSPPPSPKRNIILAPSAAETNQPEAEVLLVEKKKIIIPPKKPIIEGKPEDNTVNVVQVMEEEFSAPEITNDVKVASMQEGIVDFNTIHAQEGDAPTIIEIPVIEPLEPKEQVASIEATSLERKPQVPAVEELLLSNETYSEDQLDEIISATSEPSTGFSLITDEQEDISSLQEMPIKPPVSKDVSDENILNPLVEEVILPTQTVAVDAGITNDSKEQVASIYSIAPSDEIRVWQAKRGRNLKKTIQEWGEKENIKILWDAGDDYDLSSNIFINGTFKNAVDVLFSKGVENAPPYQITVNPSYSLHVGG